MRTEGHFLKMDRQWEHTRLIAYTIYCSTVDKDKREEIYDFLPLSTDPTKKQRQAAERRRLKKEHKAAIKQINHYKKMGWIS